MIYHLLNIYSMTGMLYICVSLLILYNGCVYGCGRQPGDMIALAESQFTAWPCSLQIRLRDVSGGDCSDACLERPAWECIYYTYTDGLCKHCVTNFAMSSPVTITSGE
jgi:hypothetical protein